MEESPAASLRRVHVRVAGVVQGVGFRPHVHRLATELGLAGRVGNDAAGVFIEVEGSDAQVRNFVRRVRQEPPPLAQIEELRVAPLTARGEVGFAIATSDARGRRDVWISPDVATCEDCLAELRDPADRRHGHAFINCTNCGPRYTIVVDVPYDRPATTMAAFELCDQCRAEYHDPTDRRFHAQPVCCPSCGPRLRLEVRGRSGEAPVAATAELLRSGAVLGIKGLGGYHLAVDATNEGAVAALRSRKHREDKPFAVMVADLDAAAGLCEVGPQEAELLTDAARPIVLLVRRVGSTLAPKVAPDNRRLGLMLPYSPVHHLLVVELDRPMVLTSGNVSDEPIAYHDGDALRRLGGIADAFLLHDRPIHMRVDDSVAQVVADRPVLLRRSRGFAPRPVRLPVAVPRPVLGCGAELKSTVCLAKGNHAFLSHHIGDLENFETFESYLQAIEHLSRLFDVQPQIVAHDLHPEYLSTKHAMELGAVDLVGVQHHHAHIASCMADNGRSDPVIGVAFDGLGWGPDDTVWGGEVLVGDLTAFERVAHLETVPMPGGPQAIREPWRMAAAHLDAAFEGRPPGDLDVRRRHRDRWEAVLSVARAGVNSPRTSSAGRLFDAVSALLSVRDVVTYEGQAAIELEQRADVTETGSYEVGLDDGVPCRIHVSDLVRAVVTDLHTGTSVPVIAARFHNGLAGCIVAACQRARELCGLTTVALSGGVFQNALLLERTLDMLVGSGFEVLTHGGVPSNDGGISLGQVAVAGARDLRR